MTDSLVRNSTPTVAIANLLFVKGYKGGHEVKTILHDQLHGSGYNVTWRTAKLRSGTLELAFATSAAAWAAVALLKTSYTFTLTADVSGVSMTFVVAPGLLEPDHPDEDIDGWTVSVPFQEVAP